MSPRKSPLSLKARAIALLAQREHSVAELRRKLLQLAQERDLKAWDEAHDLALGGPHAVAPDMASDAGMSVPQKDLGFSGRSTSSPDPLGRSGAARSAGIGSFDLDDDWEDGELEAFLDEWEAPHSESPADPPADPRADPPLPPRSQRASMLLSDLDRAQRRAFVETTTVESRRRATGAGHPSSAALSAEATDEAGERSGRFDRGSPAVPSTHAARRSTRGGAAARRPPPSAQALAAVMEEEARQARAEEVEQLLQWLQERDYLSEARLVESRINARASRYGNLRIRQELRQLGVAADEEQQAQLRDSELDRAREVWQRKFGGVLPDDAASRARQMRFLAARGFSAEVVRRVLRAPDE